MDYIKPKQVVDTLIESGIAKAGLTVPDLLIRGFLSGSLLGFGTVLAVVAALQTTLPLAGAIIFPGGFVIIVLLGFELVTGNFGLLPIALWSRRITLSHLLRNWRWVFLGNLAGSVFFAALLWISLTASGTADAGIVGAKIAAAAESKTLAYQQAGPAGMLTVLIRAILCNWMVCLGVTMALTTSSTVGKILAAWIPVSTFVALGFEHAVVNMFMIPAGMFFGAPVSVADWWIWNQIPVTIGNIIGGAVFVGLALHLTYGRKATPLAEPEPASVRQT